MHSQLVTVLTVVALLLVPAWANATVFLVDVSSCTISVVAVFDTMVELASILDPSEYILLSATLLSEVSTCNCPPTPLAVTDAQIDSLLALDSDGDFIIDCADNCPSVSNPGQDNQDGDSAGDACESASCVADSGCVPVDLINFTVE